MGLVLFLPLALVSLPLVPEHLESLHLFRRHLIPRHREVRAVELQFQHPLEQPPRGGVRVHLLQLENAWLGCHCGQIS